MIRFEVVSFAGHDVKEWDPNKPGAIKEIKEFVEEKIKAGFMAFALFKDGTGKLIQKFDEEAKRIVLMPDKLKMVKMVQPARGG